MTPEDLQENLPVHGECERRISRIMNGPTIEMPRYRCHKEVWALKIGDLQSTAAPDQESDGSLMMVPAEKPYGPFRLDAEYVRKHRPFVGGYFVRYKDGYQSFSPAEPFEDGYTRI